MLKIEKFLKQNGMNKSQLAKKAGIKQANLYAGLRNPTLATIGKISNALNVTPSQLLAAQEAKPVVKKRGRKAKYAGIELNAIVVCYDKHYEASSLQELINITKNLKSKVENEGEEEEEEE